MKVGHLELFANAALFSLSDLHKCDAVGGETGRVSMLTTCFVVVVLTELVRRILNDVLNEATTVTHNQTTSLYV